MKHLKKKALYARADKVIGKSWSVPLRGEVAVFSRILGILSILAHRRCFLPLLSDSLGQPPVSGIRVPPVEQHLLSCYKTTLQTCRQILTRCVWMCAAEASRQRTVCTPRPDLIKLSASLTQPNPARLLSSSLFSFPLLSFVGERIRST